MLSEALCLLVLGFQAVDEEEKQIYLQEGRNLTVSCAYNIMLFSSSLKAWQRVESQGPPETLVHTSTRNLSLNQARAGRYLLEDRPSDAIMMVTITELQPQDLGLYQCVIYLSPQNFHLLLPRIRLTQYKGEQQQDLDREGTLQRLTFLATSGAPSSMRAAWRDSPKSGEKL